MIFIIPTPIGNISDISQHAIKVLSECTYLICEDPRMVHKLFSLLEIKNKPVLVQFIKNNKLNEKEIIKLVEKYSFEKSKNDDVILGVVSDSGIPGLSDPGIEVIELFKDLGLRYSVLPGASSITTAAAASGLIKKEFVFLGFLPIKKGRKKSWEDIIRSQYPSIVFESVHRMSKFIQESKQNLESSRKIFIGRELSKKFETYWFGDIGELDESSVEYKGEFVIVIDSCGEKTSRKKTNQK